MNSEEDVSGRDVPEISYPLRWYHVIFFALVRVYFFIIKFSKKMNCFPLSFVPCSVVPLFTARQQLHLHEKKETENGMCA